MNLYSRLLEYNEQKIPVIMITVVSKKGDGPVEVGKKMMVTKNGHAYGTVGGGALEYNAREYCKTLFAQGKSTLQKYLLNEGTILEDTMTLPMVCGGVVELFYEYIGAKGYVTIFGGGHCSQALLKILKTMDYHVTVIEERLDVFEQIEGADRKVNINYVDFVEAEGLSDDNYVIIATPSHKHDYQVMFKVLELKLKPKYIGMLCSKKKLANFLQETYDTFGSDVDLTNFYAPIGLNIGGGSPEEIAISIAAEMLTIEYEKKGNKHLSDK